MEAVLEFPIVIGPEKLLLLLFSDTVTGPLPASVMLVVFPLLNSEIVPLTMKLPVDEPVP